jgi:hypothetical protein
MMQRDVAIWLTEVDQILMRGYCIGRVDAGWSDEDIEQFFRYDMAPNEFARWYANKYALIDFESFSTQHR